MDIEKAREQIIALGKACSVMVARIREKLSVIVPPLKLMVAKEMAFRHERNVVFFSKKASQRKNWKKWKKRK
jgi:hypothetical protein